MLNENKNFKIKNKIINYKKNHKKKLNLKINIFSLNRIFILFIKFKLSFKRQKNLKKDVINFIYDD